MQVYWSGVNRNFFLLEEQQERLEEGVWNVEWHTMSVKFHISRRCCSMDTLVAAEWWDQVPTWLVETL